MIYRVHLAWAGSELTTLVVIGTDCTGSYKSNYHTITGCHYLCKTMKLYQLTNNKDICRVQHGATSASRQRLTPASVLLKPSMLFVIVLQVLTIMQKNKKIDSTIQESRLLVPSDFDRKNKESWQLGNVFRVICYEFAGPGCFARVLKYIS